MRLKPSVLHLYIADFSYKSDCRGKASFHGMIPILKVNDEARRMLMI